MPRRYDPSPRPYGHKVTSKPPIGDRAKQIAEDPDKYADWTPVKGRGRPLKSGFRKPITLPSLTPPEKKK